MSRGVCDVSQSSAGVRPQQRPVREPSSHTGHRAALLGGAGAGGAGCDGAPEESEAGGEAAELGEGAVEALAAALLWDVPLLLLSGDLQLTAHSLVITKCAIVRFYILQILSLHLAVLTFFLRITSLSQLQDVNSSSSFFLRHGVIKLQL